MNYYDQPTLLFDALVMVSLGIVLIYDYREYDGRIFFAFLLILTGFERFFDGVLELKEKVFLFTTGQWISIVLAIVSIIFYRLKIMNRSDFRGTNTMEQPRLDHTRTLGF